MKRKVAWLAACLGVLGSGLVLANERVALVVGNANYQHAVPLANPKNDAEDMAALLRRLGFQVTAGLDLTDAAMEDRIRGFSRRARAAKVALFFYAGHGMQVDGVNYLVPVDARLADEADLPFETVALDLVLKRMGGGTNLVFLDACRDNPFARGWAGAGRSTSVGRGLTRVGEVGGSGMFIAFATDPNRIAADGEGRNSPFTAALKRHIETPGLEINGLLTEVRRTVLASTGDVQRPWSNSSLSDPFYFVPSAASPSAGLNTSMLDVDAPDPATEMWLQIRETANVQLLERYLANYPNSGYRMAAEARLDALRGQPFTVVVEPSAARVRILNIEPPYRAGMKLPAGEYRVEASAQGYKTKVEMVAHGSSPTTHRMALSRPGQSFTVVTDPAGATVRLLDHSEGYRPGMVLPPSDYRVEVSAPGYETARRTVRHGGSQPTSQRIALDRSGPFRDCADCPEMVVVPAGRFRMGDLAGFGTADERPVREVAIARDFALGRHEVTVGQFRRFVLATGHRTDADRNPDKGCWTLELMTRKKWGWTVGRSWGNLEYEIEEGQPVVCVSWSDAHAYVGWLRDRTGAPYRLPSESEWEYAARAGSGTKYHFGNDEARLCAYGNVLDGTVLPNGEVWINKATCSDGAVYPVRVGSYKANAFGLQDMHGNVLEWVQDCWNANYQGAPRDGSAWESGDCSRRVLRGSSWNSVPRDLRSANREWNSSGNRNSFSGFRVARTLTP